MTKTCEVCGVVFHRPKNKAYAVWARQRFCSHSCSNRANGAARERKPEDRFWSLVDKSEGCWLWLGSTANNGYGAFGLRRDQMVAAHRYAYSLLRGPIPLGMVIDHLCRNPSCVNPEHLEVVTNKENILRGIGPSAENAKKQVCKHGHPFTSGNTYVHVHRGKRKRLCRICRREAYGRFVLRQKNHDRGKLPWGQNRCA